MYMGARVSRIFGLKVSWPSVFSGKLNFQNLAKKYKTGEKFLEKVLTINFLYYIMVIVNTKREVPPMASNLIHTARKLIQALGTKGIKLTLSTKQFIGKEGLSQNLFIISEAVWNDEKERYANVELYSTSSAVRIMLYLRDMWYEANGWELPTDQEKWNQIRETLREGK